jgi:hypothetical protein
LFLLWTLVNWMSVICFHFEVFVQQNVFLFGNFQFLYLGFFVLAYYLFELILISFVSLLLRLMNFIIERSCIWIESRQRLRYSLGYD